MPATACPTWPIWTKSSRGVVIEKMLVKLILIASTVFFVGLAYLTWQNREMQRVAEIAATVILVAILGGLASVAVSLKPQQKALSFPVVYFYNADTMNPLALEDMSREELAAGDRNGVSASFPIQKLRGLRTIPLEDDALGGRAYFDVVTYLVLKELFQFFSRGWNIRVSRFDLPGATQTSFGPNEQANDYGEPACSVVLSWNEMSSLFPSAVIVGHPDSHMTNNSLSCICLPPGTSITATDGEHSRVITLKNRFVSLEISINRNTSQRGLGEFHSLLGFDRGMDDKYITSSYIVTLRADFSRWYTGHPKRRHYENWIGNVFSILEKGLSYEVQKAQIAEWILYRKPNAIKDN